MTFDETEHPRGNPGNAGQFRQKEHSAPEASLTPPGVWATKLEALRTDRAALMKHLGVVAAKNAAHTARGLTQDAATVHLELSEHGDSFWAGAVYNAAGEHIEDLDYEDVVDIPIAWTEDQTWLSPNPDVEGDAVLDVAAALAATNEEGQ